MKMQELDLSEMTEITGGKTIIKVWGSFNTVIGTQNGAVNVGSLNVFFFGFPR